MQGFNIASVKEEWLNNHHVKLYTFDGMSSPRGTRDYHAGDMGDLSCSVPGIIILLILIEFILPLFNILLRNINVFTN